MESQLDICKTDIILYVKFTFRLVGDVIWKIDLKESEKKKE